VAADNSEGAAEFDIERSTAQAWAAFAGRLADVLSVMEGDAALTIGALATEHDGRPPYVAFHAAPGGRLRAEAAGNDQLGSFFRLTPAQQDALGALGWSAPDAAHPAFWAEGTQEEAAALADRAVAALRDVYGVPHPAFLAPDQLAEILTPAPARELPHEPAPEFAAAELSCTLPASREQLLGLVGAHLAGLLGHLPVQDADGDFGVRVGSTMVFVRATTDAAEVLVFAPLVHDVEGRSRAMEVLSDLNTDARFVRFLLLRDRVFVSMSVLARPFVPAHLTQALRIVSVTSDSIDDDLAVKLRGRTTFPTEGPGGAPGGGAR